MRELKLVMIVILDRCAKDQIRSRQARHVIGVFQLNVLIAAMAA
jgi:hypothetical protein